MIGRKEQIKISVRGLVEFIFRSGDIDNRHTGAKDKQAMDAGSRLHRKLQKQAGSAYQAEVPLKFRLSSELYELTVEGRADGIFPDEDMYVIDEIKGVYRDISHLEEPVFVHRAQAMCYAYIYARNEELPYIGVQMTYANLETEEIRRFREDFSFPELEEWFEALMEAYARWANLLCSMRLDMRSSQEDMEFPFDYRPGQRKLAVSVYQTIRQKKELFIQAPTGIGKTMSVLFPSVKAMGQGLADKVFYLTAKTVTRTVAEEALNILRDRGLLMSSVTLTAKEKICPQETCSCNPGDCPYAAGHFDRINDALYDILTHEMSMSRENITEYAIKHQVCPFEFSLDLTLFTQSVICDYNYVYDPNVYLRRFFGDTVTERFIFLVDEAHNLPERARSMYSATLVKEEVLEAEKTLRNVQKGMDTPEAVKAAAKAAKALRSLNKALLELKKEYSAAKRLSSVDLLAAKTAQVQDDMSAYLEETRNTAEEELLNFYFELRHFNAMYEIMDEHYLTYCAPAQGRFYVKLLCANPAAVIENCAARSVASIYFSATLLPMGYYKELLTTEKDSYAIYVDSPFDQNRRLLTISRDLSSRYTERNQAQYEKVWEYIRKITKARAGNYMVFFPSYQYMQNVYEVCEKWLDENVHDLNVLVQESGMREEDREAFLKEFESDSGTRTLIGFCVIGGIFSEGIDLTGEKLIGTIIVGTGLGQLDMEGGFLKDYFSEQGYDGFDYAYRYPGINRVFQAAGRVIRTVEDRGVIVLLDNRLLKEDHVRLFPMDWDNYQETTVLRIERDVADFWKQSEKP